MAGKKTSLTLARKSRKRRAPGDDQIEPIGQGARKLAETGSLLLGMPAEIRAKILRELLCAEEDLLHMNGREGGISQIYLAILTTCRQLHHEGIDLLHGNRINFHIIDRFNDLQEELRNTMLSMSTKFSKIGFTITYEEFFDDEIYDYDSRKVTHEWTEAIRTAKHWTDIRIEARGQPLSQQSSASSNGNDVEDDLEPFGMLRRIKTVEIVGDVSTTYARELAKLIQGETPVVDLMAMYKSLERWVNRIDNTYGVSCDRDALDDELERAHAAALGMDPEMFYNCRKDALAAFESEYNPEALDVYASDPDPLKAEYKAHADMGQGMLDEMVEEAEDDPEVDSESLLADFDKRIGELQDNRRRPVAAISYHNSRFQYQGNHLYIAWRIALPPTPASSARRWCASRLLFVSLRLSMFKHYIFRMISLIIVDSIPSPHLYLPQTPVALHSRNFVLCFFQLLSFPSLLL